MILGVPTLCCYDALDRLIESAERGSVKPHRYVIIDNGGSYEPKTDARCSVVRFGRNLGVAASWNLILKCGEPVVISNDDVVFERETFARFVEASERACLAVSTAGWDLFAQTPEAVERIGWYDEKFYPAYYEDSDYARRAALAGVEPLVVDVPYRHDRSMTVRTYPEAWQIKQGSVRSHERFIRKWGAHPAKRSTPCRSRG